MLTTRKWLGAWIAGVKGWIDLGYERGKDIAKFTPPAPYLRKHFKLDKRPKNAIFYLATAGWHELYVNGQKVDDRVLTPCVSQFDVHINYLEYDLTNLLVKGENAITVMLGNGAFNANTSEVWNFLHANWRDYPRMCCELIIDGDLAVKSDNSWKHMDSPIVFDSLRSGETYDFTKEIQGVFDASYDDSAWEQAFISRPPAGIPILEDIEPCRILETSTPVEIRKLDDETVLFDMGKNITGWAELDINLLEEITDPLEVTLSFSEQINPDGTADRASLSMYIFDGWECQIGRMFLAPGRKQFHWRPHFTYFGYRYIHLHCKKLSIIEVTRLQALFIHNDFETTGHFESSSNELNRLQEVTLRSVLTNYTGIPTDCPHREKNGWSDDQSMAMRSIMWNFNTIKAYRNFMQVYVDGQRPSGTLPPIAPCSGWYADVGPGGDYVIFQAAWETYLFYGDDSIIQNHYDAMKRYLEFEEKMIVDGLVEHGLPDWCAPDVERYPSVGLTSSAWVFSMYERMQVFAKMTGHEEDLPWLSTKAEEIRLSILRHFLNPDGSVDKDYTCALACLPYFHICDKATEKKLVERLVQQLRDHKHKVDFGIYGAKWIPRVLGDYGYTADALQILLQKEYPGFQYMLDNGATTLWETFDGKGSRDHIMFGDHSAWCFEYLAGIRPLFEGAGFTKIDLIPNVVPQLDYFHAEHILPNGKQIKAGWSRKDGKVVYNVTIPEGTQSTLRMPGSMPIQVPAGESEYIL